MTSEPPGWSAPGPGGWSAPPSSPPPPPAAPPGWGAPTGWGGPPAGPGYFAPRVPEVRPGVVPLRPLGIGEIIDGAISTMRRHWKLQLGLSAIVVTAVSVLQAAALFLLYRNPSGIEGGDLTGPEGDVSAAANFAQIITTVVGQLAQMVLIGILVFIVSRAVLGEDVTPAQAWAAVRPHLWRLVVLSVLVMVLMGVLIGLAILVTVLVAVAGAPTGVVIGVGVLAGLIAVPAAVWLWVRLGVSAPTLVLERTTIRTAMRRSSRLVRRSWWRVFGVLLLSTVMAAVRTVSPKTSAVRRPVRPSLPRRARSPHRPRSINAVSSTSDQRPPGALSAVRLNRSPSRSRASSVIRSNSVGFWLVYAGSASSARAASRASAASGTTGTVHGSAGTLTRGHPPGRSEPG